MSAIRFDSYFVTGGWQSVAKHLERSISHFARSDRGVSGIYIGISSGSDQLKAMKRRVDDYKADCQIGRMVCIYETSSHNFATKLERHLIEARMAKTDDRLLNRRLGGGGRIPGPEMMNYVYLALQYGQELPLNETYTLE